MLAGFDVFAFYQSCQTFKAPIVSRKDPSLGMIILERDSETSKCRMMAADRFECVGWRYARGTEIGLDACRTWSEEAKFRDAKSSQGRPM